MSIGTGVVGTGVVDCLVDFLLNISGSIMLGVSDSFLLPLSFSALLDPFSFLPPLCSGTGCSEGNSTIDIASS